MTKLNDIQLILLTSAAQRENGSLLPVAASVADAGDRLKKAITSLRKHSFIEEQPTADAQASWRTDGDDQFGLFIKDAGRAAINLVPEEPIPQKKERAKAPAAQPPKPGRQTKSAAVIALLQRADGATIAEIVEATGWLKHTTRAALTGLKKKGFTIEKSKRGDETCYRITGEA